MDRLSSLQEKLKTATGEAVAIRKQYENSSENMSDDDATRFDAAMVVADGLDEEIVREKKAISFQQLTATIDAPMLFPDQGDKNEKEIATKQMSIFREYLKWGEKSTAYIKGATELKGLQADLDTSGGYLVMPMMVVNEFIKFVDNAVSMRGLCTVFTMPNAESIGAPSLDTDLNDADWTTELQTGQIDNAMRFGRRALTPHPFAKRVKLSNTLIRKSMMDPDALLRARLAYKFAVTEELGFLLGSGAGQALGVFTASAQGIDTSRDVSTSNTTSSPTADGLIEAKHSLKTPYWNDATWLFHRDVFKKIRLLKDGNGQYLWQAGISGGVPSTILDNPYVLSEYAPNTFTTGQYVGIIGDFKKYWIVDSLAMSVRRVDELYAETDEVGFIGRAEADGMPILAESFIRVKLA